VQEDGVVAGRVVVLARGVLDLSGLLAQPSGAFVDERLAAGREGDVVDPDAIAVIWRGVSAGLALAQTQRSATAVAAEIDDPLAALAGDLSDMDVTQGLEQATVEDEASLKRSDHKVQVIDRLHSRRSYPHAVAPAQRRPMTTVRACTASRSACGAASRMGRGKVRQRPNWRGEVP